MVRHDAVTQPTGSAAAHTENTRRVRDQQRHRGSTGIGFVVANSHITLRHRDGAGRCSAGRSRIHGGTHGRDRGRGRGRGRCRPARMHVTAGTPGRPQRQSSARPYGTHHLVLPPPTKRPPSIRGRTGHPPRIPMSALGEEAMGTTPASRAPPPPGHPFDRPCTPLDAQQRTLTRSRPAPGADPPPRQPEVSPPPIAGGGERQRGRKRGAARRLVPAHERSRPQDDGHISPQAFFPWPKKPSHRQVLPPPTRSAPPSPSANSTCRSARSTCGRVNALESQL